MVRLMGPEFQSMIAWLMILRKKVMTEECDRHMCFCHSSQKAKKERGESQT